MNSKNYHLRTIIVLLTVCTSVFADQWPIWEETLKKTLTAGIEEDTAVGTSVGTLRATDPDGEAVLFAGGADIFRVDPNRGSVILNRPLDAEREKYIPVTFTAKAGKNEIDAAYTVKVKDVNDNTPTFEFVPYSTNVYEGDVAQSLVFDGIVAKDLDSGVNGEIEFTCIRASSAGARACDMFSVTGSRFGKGIYRGLIHLAKDLPDKGGARYTMTIQAQDKGIDKKSVRTDITINVYQVESTPPKLQNLPAAFTVFESDKANSIVGEVAVSYPNSTNNAPIGVKIVRDLDGYFSMSAAQVESRIVGTSDLRYYSRIILNKQLDREAIGDSYFFDIRAEDLRDPSRFSISTVGVTVGDANDHPPTFDKDNYEFSIPEGLPNGANLEGINLVVTDVDSEENSKYELSISEASFYSFRLTPRNGSGTTSFSLVVDEARYLDYEQEENRLQALVITAREVQSVDPLSGSATVTIRLEDRNDNTPKFAQTSYRASVREDRPPGYTIMTVTATDEDSGEFGKIIYNFQTGNLDFNVDRNTGEITLKQPLSYSSNPNLQATLRATDGDGKYVDVPFSVSVREYNPDGPEFEDSRYESRVERDSTILNPPVQVLASLVESPDEIIQYKIVDGNLNNSFSIDESTGQISLTKLITKKDTPGRSGYFTLIVEAFVVRSRSRSNTVPVIIFVLESENNPPSFTETVIIKQMMENALPGSSVTKVTAVDNDEGSNGVVRYSISGGGMGKFDIDSLYGEIRLARGATLDIERSLTADYSLEVIAADQGAPPLTATATVIINVQDYNNKAPEFSQKIYRGSVLEIQNVGTQVLTIQASDPDTSANILYSINEQSYEAKAPNGNRFYDTRRFDYTSTFQLHPTSGVITTARRLDYKLVAEVSFEVIATDTQGANQQDKATVVIYIQSSGIDYLIFEPPSATVDFNEEEPSGTVVTGLVAKDPRTQHPADTYEKLVGSDPNDYFFVNQTNGEITLTKRLDYETMPVKQIFVQMRASSTSGSVVKTAIGTITVNVKDINDQFPIFDKNGYSFEVSELARYPTVIGQVRTTDKDTEQYYKDRRFTLTGPGADSFEVDSNTGHVSVSLTATLDREKQEMYSLLVTAADNPNRLGSGERRATTVQLVIRLLDKNDNEPKFSKSLYTIITSENVIAGIILLNAQATDRDAGVNSKLTYRFNPSSYLFDVDNLGNIRTSRSLEGHYKENPYVFNLEATDSASIESERMTGTTVVHIHVEKGQAGDQGRPVITYPGSDYMEVHVEEEGAFVKRVLTINATDPENDPLVYTLLNNPALDHHKYFRIRNTNEIWSKDRLDRETKEKYEVVIEVTDVNPKPKGAIRTFFIRLTDIDDNKPGFGNCSEAIKAENGRIKIIQEDVDINHRVTRVIACDDDAPPNNTTFYFITCGNSPLTEGEAPPFRIDQTTGNIYTNARMDSSKQNQYKLCIYVSERNNIVGNEGKFDPDGNPPDNGIVIYIYVDDAGTGPVIKIPDSGYLSGFVLNGDTYGTEVMRIQTRNGQTNLVYRIVQQTFKGEKVNAFKIDKNTGIITTNMDDFYRYSTGYFKIIVEVELNGKTTQVPMYVSVVNPNSRIRYRFQKSAEDVYNFYPNLLREIQEERKVMLVGDTLSYGVRMQGQPDKDSSDLCFYVIKDSLALSRQDALDELDTNIHPALRPIYNKYGVNSVEFCERALSSARWWGGWWWPWWVIIASAAFIIVCCLILICILFLFKDWRGPGMEWQSSTHYIQD